jgi:hypothetical protein
LAIGLLRPLGHSVVARSTSPRTGESQGSREQIGVYGKEEDKMNDEVVKIHIREIEREMPDLILDMMCWLRCSIGESIREFYVLKTKNDKHGSSSPFTWCEEDDPDLQANLSRLIANGYIVPVEPDVAPIYRMTDEFADLLLEGWPKKRWPDWSF